MYRQKRIIDTVRELTPTREAWTAGAERVTVSLHSGHDGMLDLKDPLSAHWAELIDRQRKANGPVYVEIDEDSGVITNVRIPRRFRVERLDEDTHGNLRVALDPSQAAHLLLRSDPGFDAMRTSLEAALADGSERLITETRDEHEILDVRLPPAEGEAAPGPAPPLLPDPAILESRAVEVYGNMNGQSCSPCNPSTDCIPFLFPDDGCWIRAHIMAHLMRNGGPDPTTNPPEDPAKVWIDASHFLGLVAPTANHPDCQVQWNWHVAPTLLVSTAGGDERWVIDPSLSPAPESEAAWKGRQGDPPATLTETDWTVYAHNGGPANVSLAQALTNMQPYRDDLKARCLELGPPPYSCTRDCFFIVDRSTFSSYEVEAMLLGANPAVVESALYVVADGFSPQDDLGFTAATMQVTPTLTVSPGLPSGMTITPVRLDFEYPTHLQRRQRLTWVYDVAFTNTSAFTSELITLTLEAGISGLSASAHLYLTLQPNPYEMDGATCWLSTDLRVFQILAGQSRLGATMGSDPNAFITQVIANLNSGNTGGQTFENDISTDQQTSRLELSGTVGGTAVYNFAVAKVRYRALAMPATDVRVFFRLFTVATTSLAYDTTTAYRRATSGSSVIPLLGITNNEVGSIPCFAAPRIDTGTTSMTAQTDAPNVQTIPPNASGTEVVRYFGSWLDLNQTTPRFPLQPSPADGPWSSGTKSIQDLIRNEHQCLVSEIDFTPAPIPAQATPSGSDRLAQRNLAIVESANPGQDASRRIPQTFEIRPSGGKDEYEEPDELMIDWGNVPANTVAILYVPGLDVGDILRLARRYRSHRLLRIDVHTLKILAGGMTYLPLPATSATLPALLTIQLPEGVHKGQAFRVVVRQVTGGMRRSPRPSLATHAATYGRPIRHVVGSFQLTIPVRSSGDMLPAQQRLLSNLRWIQRAIPPANRWAPVFGRYVTETANRVNALGGDAGRVAPSSTGQWEQARRNCMLLMLLVVLCIAVLVVIAGTAAGGLTAAIGVAVLALLGVVFVRWRKACRPTTCQVIKAFLAGFAVGAVALAILLLLGRSTAQLVAALVAAGALAVGCAILGWAKHCFGRSRM